MGGDELVVGEWARKLAPLCGESVETCATWLAAFLTAIRLERCRHLPDEPRACGHEHPASEARTCRECALTLARREGHTEAGVYWTAGEVIALAGR